MDRRSALIFLAAGLSSELAMLASEAVAKRLAPARPLAALVMGFGYAYTRSGLYLPNAIPDAELVADTLRGMQVPTVITLLDPNVNSLVTMLADFRTKAAMTGLGVVYISGHGVQIDGVNYLLAADGVSLIELVSLIRYLHAGVRTLVVFVDACRNNPFVVEPPAGQNLASRSIYVTRAADDPTVIGGFAVQHLNETGRVANGLARFDLTGSGLKIVFATDPNNVAFDSTDPNQTNGPFAMALAKSLPQRQGLDAVLADVTRDVRAMTDGKQTPWQQGALEQVVYLAGPPPRFGDGVRDNMPSP